MAFFLNLFPISLFVLPPILNPKPVSGACFVCVTQRERERGEERQRWIESKATEVKLFIGYLKRKLPMSKSGNVDILSSGLASGSAICGEGFK